VSTLRPFGATAAVVQGPDINKGTYIQIYQSTISLKMIGFTFLKGLDNEIVGKEVAVADYHSNRVSSYVFKRLYCSEEVPMLNAKINNAINHGCNWNDGDALYSELESVLHREVSSVVVIYCFGHQKTNFISGLINRTVDIIQLGCHELADINLPAISCTFACHNKSKHVCALRTAYSLAQWLKYYILSLQYAKCPPQPGYH
jgi:hypothetical protein